MKRKGQKYENRILLYVVLCSVLFVGCLCIFAGSYLYFFDKNGEKNNNASGKETMLVKEAGAVEAKNAAVRNFLNMPAPEAASEDKREVIRIVEVIPHEACSIFPYLIEWGSKEAYDKNTPLGYDGIRYMASCMTGNNQFNTQTGIYSYLAGGITSPTLTDYSVSFTTKNSSNGSDLWWREVEINSNVTASGYFEYVGNNKGLYSINLNPENIIEDKDTVKHGIRYRVQAMERKGSEDPKGEWQVKEPAYYWSKASKGAYPIGEIKQRTDYNYDLKFSEVSSNTGIDYQYKAQYFNVKSDNSENTENEKYDYQAKLKSGVSWTAGYTFCDKGNYTVYNIMPHTVTEQEIKDGLPNLTGKYIRIENKDTDGIAGMKPGYFRLYSEKSDSGRIVVGDTYYELSFQNVEPGKGKYVLNPAAVKTAKIDNFIFDYIGENKGTCEVSFICSESITGVPVYSAEIVKVTDGEGTYALTSKEAQEENLYIKVSGEAGDYSKVVTNIDCLGIDYNTSSEGWYGYGEPPAGLCVGQINSNPDTNQGYLGEKGDWVFHTISSDKINGITKLEEFDNGIPERIYVYNQNRKNRYYAQNGFMSNEWFKLLIYLSNEDGTEGLATKDYANIYTTGDSGKSIVERYKEEISAFDQKYRVEIIQRTPSKLTVDEVESADLIYIAQSVGIYVLDDSGVWQKIDDHIPADLPPMPSQLKYAEGDVISDDVLMAIYKNCLYHEDGKTPATALMIDAPALRDSGNGHMSGERTVDNFGKLYYFVDLFDDPAEFANFISGYMENTAHFNNNDGYSTILPKDGCKISLYKNDHDLYNQGIIHLNQKTALEQSFDQQWEVKYFQVRQLTEDSNKYVNAVWNNGGVLNGAYDGFMADGSSIYGKAVEENSGRTWYAPVTYGQIFERPNDILNIWRIMHNRTSKKASTPKVIVTNADDTKLPDTKNTATSYYFYLDEFMVSEPDAFHVKYKISWTPEEVTEPNPLASIVFKRASGESVQTQESPSYNTEYTCDVRGDFVDAEGAWNGTRMMQYLITATDKAGKSDTASVFVIFRDSFMLN